MNRTSTRVRRGGLRGGRWLPAVALVLLGPGALAAAAGPPPASAPTPRETSEPPADVALADDLDDIALLDLDVDTVVTAGRHEQRIDDVPYAISVITAEDIRRSGARSIPDALRLAAGVDVADLSFVNAAVSPRGFHALLARQVLVLVDGRQIFDSFFGGTLWGSWPFELEDIARIEVIRGPGGVTWGANAVNGVINIITKEPRQQQGLTFIAGGGSRGWHKEYLAYGYADDRLQLRISGQYDAADGFRRGGNALRNLDDDYQRGNVNVYAVYQRSAADTLTFSLGSHVMDGGYPPSPLGGLRAAHPASQSNYALVKWRRRIAEDNTIELTGYVNDFMVIPGLRSADWRYQQIALQLRHTFTPAPHHRLTWGIDTRLDLVDATNADPFMLTKSYVTSGIVGAYIRDEWRFASRWTLHAGARLDYDSYGGFQPSGRLALAYRVGEHHAVYGAVSRAFQMVPGAFRLMNTPFFDGLVHAWANREIDPETLVAYELGYRGSYLDQRLKLSVAAFWHEMWDITTISPRPGPPGLVRMDEDNRAAASLYGVELEGRFDLSKRLTLLGNYTYQQFDWDSRAAVHEKDMMSPPRHKFMVGLRWNPLDRLNLSSHLYWTDSVEAPTSWNPLTARPVDSYFRLDLMGEYEIWKQRAWLSVGVRNLLDNHHPEGGSVFLNDAEVPRLIYAELRVRVK